MDRPELTADDINAVIYKLQKEVARRLNEKGKGIFISADEMLGAITQEYHELIEAVHSGERSDIEDELIDLAVGAVISAACIMSKKVDW